MYYSAFTATLSNSDIILQNDVYSFELSGNTHYLRNNGYNNSLSNPFSLSTSGFTTGITGSSYACVAKLADEDNCCPQDSIPEAKPWAYQINHGAGVDNCSYKVQRRTEKGWTIDLVLNRDGLSWSNGKTIYYLGVRGENDLRDYADNNLSFSFTSDGRIQWRAIRYSGVCVTNSGYTETFYTSSGQTPVLCTNGTSNDFNITISFEREPTAEEIAGVLDVDVDEVSATLGMSAKHISMDQPIAEGEEGSLIDLMANPNAESADGELVVNHSLNTEIERTLNSLTVRQKEVLVYFYGIGIDHPLSLEDIGARYNLTRERVRQIKDKAILKLQSSAQCNLLRGFLGA